MSNNVEQKYYEGFIKAAVVNGLSFPEAIGLYKQSFMGNPAAGAASMGEAASHMPAGGFGMSGAIPGAMGAMESPSPGILQKIMDFVKGHPKTTGLGAMGAAGTAGYELGDYNASPIDGSALGHPGAGGGQPSAGGGQPSAGGGQPGAGGGQPGAGGIPEWAKLLGMAGVGAGAGGLGAMALMPHEKEKEQQHMMA